MFAYINASCMIAAVLVDRAAICCLLCFYALRCRSVVFLCSGYGFKYLLQRTFPCSQSLFHCNFYIPIGKHCIIFYFTNHNACDRKLCHFICRYFCYDASEICCKEVFFCYLCINLDTFVVTKCHLAECCCQTISVQCIGRYDPACFNIFKEFMILIHDLFIIRQIISITLDFQQNQFVSRFFQFRCNHGLVTCHIYSKRYQCRRNIDLIEGSGHTVFSSDGRQSKSELCIVCTKQCQERLAPSCRIFGHTTEVLLESETDLAEISAACNDT